MTMTDYISSISLLPTVDFLEYIAKKQWETEASYGVGFSTIPPLFYSTTNSEWLCLNSESEFLESPQGTAAIKNPFSYTRPESSPVFIALNDLRVKPTQIKNAKSLFLFRSIGTKTEVITVSNYDKNPDNTTTAPPLDCFSRECLTWFSSGVDWFIGFGNLSGSLKKLVVDNDGVTVNKSEDILDGLNHSTIQLISHTSIDIYSPTTITPYAFIEFGTGAIIQPQTDINTMFLFTVNGEDSLVGFAHQNLGANPINATIELAISYQSTDIIIV